MKADITTKTCAMCCTEIPKKARKCPHCHHFQNRSSMILYHPAFAVLLTCLPLAGMFFGFMAIFDQGEDYQSYTSQIQIVDSQIAFGDTKSSSTVVVVGTITNASSVPWKDVQFHADFFDAQGKLIDVGERESYSFYLPANGASSFKVSFRREFPESNYVKHQVRAVTAKDARGRW